VEFGEIINAVSMWAQVSLVLSQCTHLTYRQTGGPLQYCVLHFLHGKNYVTQRFSVKYGELGLFADLCIATVASEEITSYHEPSASEPRSTQRIARTIVAERVRSVVARNRTRRRRLLSSSSEVCYSFRPFSSDRQHLSYDVCLEVRGEITRTVLYCIVY